MSDIFDEVDEGVRKDKMETWWSSNQVYVYAVIGVIVGGVALNEFVLKPTKAKGIAERAHVLETGMVALEEDRFEVAEASFSELAAGKSKLAPIAANMLAETRLEQGDTEGAAQALAAAGTVEGGPYARLALLKTAYAKADSLSLSELEAVLGSLSVEDGPTGALARELLAAKAWKEGDNARARTEFNRLRLDPNAPEGLRQRAELAMAAIPKASVEAADAETDAEDTSEAVDAAEPDTETDPVDTNTPAEETEQ